MSKTKVQDATTLQAQQAIRENPSTQSTEPPALNGEAFREWWERNPPTANALGTEAGIAPEALMAHLDRAEGLLLRRSGIENILRDNTRAMPLNAIRINHHEGVLIGGPMHNRVVAARGQEIRVPVIHNTNPFQYVDAGVTDYTRLDTREERYIAMGWFDSNGRPIYMHEPLHQAILPRVEQEIPF